jgi:tRNA pseudouridine55 synthase
MSAGGPGDQGGAAAGGAKDAPVGDGVVVVDKPAGWTSHDVVARLRRRAGTRRVGHAGTLDPMATGVLVVGVNRATRLLTYLVGADKEYAATIRLGQDTLTDDAEGEVTAAPGAAEVDPGRLRAAVAGLTGEISQVPSAVSAIKVAGRRSYARVRAGEAVALAARPVVVHRFDVVEARGARAGDGTAVTDVDVVITCSSGTYVRALARDLGAALGTGGHLTALRRTRVGAFTLADAATPEELGTHLPLLDPAVVARRCFRVRDVDDAEAAALRHGRGLDLPEGRRAGGDAPVAAIDRRGILLALLVERAGRAHPVLVLDPA